MCSCSVSGGALLGSEGSETSRGSVSSSRVTITHGRADSSKAVASGSRHWRIWRPFTVLSSDSDEAINELDRELTRSYFLDDSDESGQLGCNVGAIGDRDVGGLNVEAPGGHITEDEFATEIGGEFKGVDEGEQNRERGGEQDGVLANEQNVEFGADQTPEILVGRQNSPTYTEYSARYDFDWPELPHRVSVENEYQASKIASVIDADMLGQLYRAYETPKDVFFWAPEADERADQPPKGCVAVNVDTMEAGLQFPLHPSITCLLVEWNITITQLMPNGWHMIMSFLTLFGKKKPFYYPTAAELTRLVHLTQPKGEHVWLYM